MKLNTFFDFCHRPANVFLQIFKDTFFSFNFSFFYLSKYFCFLRKNKINSNRDNAFNLKSIKEPFNIKVLKL